ncbi:MAG: DNA methyltransferase, partial [Nitrososphaerales archaeon]
PSYFWRTNLEGMNALKAASRLVVVGNTLSWKQYVDDFPLTSVKALWADTMPSGFAGESSLYVVQTSTKVVERCILMTTDPGDLVFDPTCGSGTTAFCAEKWGRRWITCDTSRVAVTIARQRLMTTTLHYFRLAQPTEGVRSGFVYDEVPHMTLRSIAHGDAAEREILYDKPKIDKSAIRISGPFTMEAIPAPSAQSVEKSSSDVDAENYVSTLIDAIRMSGVIFPRGKKLKLEGVVPVSSSSFLHAEGTSSNGDKRRVVISFGPRYGPLSARQAEEAIRAATVAGYQLLVLVGFQIDPAAEAFVQRTNVKIDVQFAHINPDMEIHDLLKQTQGSQLFSVFGQPDIELTNMGEKCVVKLLGVDVYDPISGNTEQTSGDAIPAWFLDEDYDGYSFNVCQAFFPDGATGKNPWDKLENALHGIIDNEKLDRLKTCESIPFEYGAHRTIAVKVFDNRGNEVIKIRKLEGSKKA